MSNRLLISVSKNLERKYSLLHNAVVDSVELFEFRNGRSVERMDKSDGYDLKVNGVKIRIFVSNHKGGIINEDGVAISLKGFSSMNREDIIRVVSIPDEKYLDYFIGDFNFKHRPEPELQSMVYAGMTRKQRRTILEKGKDFDFKWLN